MSKDTHIRAFIACLLWSTAFVGIKIGLPYTTPLNFAGSRFMVSGLMLLPFAGPLSRYFSEIRTHLALVLTIAFFQTFLVYALFYTGMTMLDGALAAIVIGSSPLISAVTAHVMLKDDKLSRKKFFSIAVGMSGVVLISLSRQPWSVDGFQDLIGVILLLACSTSSAVANVLASKSQKTISTLTLTSAQLFLGGLGLWIVSLPIEGFPRTHFPTHYYASFFWLAFISAAAFALWYKALKRPGVQVSTINVWKFVLPLFGALLSWLLLPDESPDFFSVMGMIIVALSIIFYNVAQKRKAPL